jgi:hypothetical protein
VDGLPRVPNRQPKAPDDASRLNDIVIHLQTLLDKVMTDWNGLRFNEDGMDDAPYLPGIEEPLATSWIEEDAA